MDCIRISITADEPLQEILIGQLSELGAEGFEQTEDRLIAYFNSHLFPSYEVHSLLQDYDADTQTVAGRNWNAVWEENFPPVQVGDFCAVRADFHPPMSGVQHEIIITPKMSFGTGHHATTYMMIDQMKDISFAGKKVFDFGTGTGILAILAEKLGAVSITGIDVDDWSIRNAVENAERNNCCCIHVSLTAELPNDMFDVILANINRNVILQYITGLQGILQPEGLLLLSGLLTEDERDIVEACNKVHVRLIKRQERNKWISLLLMNENR